VHNLQLFGDLKGFFKQAQCGEGFYCLFFFVSFFVYNLFETGTDYGVMVKVIRACCTKRAC